MVLRPADDYVISKASSFSPERICLLRNIPPYETGVVLILEIVMRCALLVVMSLGLAACIHTETVKPVPSSTTVVTPPSSNTTTSTTVTRPTY